MASITSSPTRTDANVSHEELRSRLRDPRLAIVDVLTHESYREGHIPGAISLPLTEIDGRAREVLPDVDREIAVYCGSST